MAYFYEFSFESKGGFDGEPNLAALLYRIDGQAAREVCVIFYVCTSFDTCIDCDICAARDAFDTCAARVIIDCEVCAARVICTDCNVCAARDVSDACAAHIIPAKTAVLKQKRLYRIDGTVACSDSYFFGVTVPRMLKTILSGVPLVDTVIDLAMPPIRLVS